MNSGETENLKRIAAATPKAINAPSTKVIYACIRTNDLDIHYDILRIDDEQYFLFMKYALPIRQDYCLEMDIQWRRDLVTSRLSTAYAALKLVFGESGNCYDDWKGSFAFTFLILRKDQPDFRYVLRVSHYRSGLDFGFYRILSEVPARDKLAVYVSPDEEFSKEQMSQVIYYLLNWLTGYFSVRSSDFQENFCKKCDSNFILFGCKNGEFFDKQYDDEKQFHHAFNKITKSL